MKHYPEVELVAQESNAPQILKHRQNVLAFNKICRFGKVIIK